MLYLWTTFVITTSSDSPRILNYSKDSKSRLVWLDLCLSSLIANRPGFHFGQGIHPGDHQDDMHTQYLTNEEDIEFPKCHLLSKCLETAWKLTHREIGITATISSGLEHGQGVFRCVLQSLCYNLADMHKLTPNIAEVMTFPKWLSVKQNLREVLCGICPV
jgi:hypothetical protein